jgi:tartrate-resistant acid phosphatase type 5
MSPLPLLLILLPTLCAGQKDLGRILPVGRSIHLVALGDFGSGSRHQSDVAQAIKRRHQQSPFDFGVTLGDNFYRCGVRNVDDAKWQTRWEDLYAPLGIRFYASLGNHDYGHPSIVCPANQASPQAEIDRSEHSKSWSMPARYYTFIAGAARFIAIDTEGWSDAQLQWIRETLLKATNEPGIKWRIVYGHHPIYTSGHHLNERRIAVLRRDLLPVLREGKVDLVISGHDHDMEHLSYENAGQKMDFLIAGIGGAELRAPGAPQPHSLFRGAEYGFLDLVVDDSHIAAQFLNVNLMSLESPVLRKTQ